MSSANSADTDSIRTVLERYCTAIDSLDWPALRRCFTGGAHVDYRGMVAGEIDDFIGYLDSPLGPRELDRTEHVLLETRIEVSAQHAIAKSDFRAQHYGSAGHPWCAGVITAWGRYEDELEFSPANAWRISGRLAVVERIHDSVTGIERQLEPS